MAELFVNGRIADCILVLMLLEVVALTLLRRRSGRGIRPVELIVSTGAGAALLLALRAALVGSAWPRIAIWLVAALAAHLYDLRLRWRTTR